MKYTLEQALKAKEELENSELYLLGFNSAQKKFKIKLKDLYNAKNSQYKELTKPKLDRRNITEEGIKLETEVKLLKELMKICG